MKIIIAIATLFCLLQLLVGAALMYHYMSSSEIIQKREATIDSLQTVNKDLRLIIDEHGCEWRGVNK